MRSRNVENKIHYTGKVNLLVYEDFTCGALRPLNSLDMRLAKPRASLDAMQKRKIPCPNENQTFIPPSSTPYLSLYTDCTLLAPQ